MTKRSSSITIRDVAQKAGVSVATVSRFINKNAPISPEVAERLQTVMVDLKYVPHAAARHLASRKTRLVGLLLNNLHNDFFIALLNGIEPVVRKKEHNLIIATYHFDSRNVMPPPVGPHNTDGMLVFADGLTNDELISLQSTGFPMVLVHRLPPTGVHIPSVTIENTKVTAELTEHLIKVHGRRRILFLRGPANQEDSGLREVGFRSALAANNIPVDECLFLYGEFERDFAYQAMNEFIGKNGRDAFDAVFTGDDDAAIGVLKSLHEHEIRVPEDVSVAGFDDLGFAQFLNPPLTTVRAPTGLIGKVATDRLFCLLENRQFDEVTIMPASIIYRSSCGCVS